STHGDDIAPALFEPSASDVEVDVRYRAAAAPLLADYVVVDEQGGDAAVRTARIRLGDERSLKRVAARLGGDLEVLAPAGARRAAAAWAEAGLAQYR
ncbi:WYL domain-containing protein, partial [Microbacterium sp.]|uniref:WYL domain-containing protein n=1 Tax=Microbacterium sp. TaxID=51671 RepID=UPI0037C5D169